MIANGRLLHAYRAGEAKAPATANDYANMIRAALALANVTGKRSYIEWAREWTDILDKHYWADVHRRLLFRSRRHLGSHRAADERTDEATPNGNGTMVSNFMALTLWTGDERYRERADAVLRAFAGAMRQNVLAHAGLFAAALDVMAPALTVFVVPEGSDARALRRTLDAVSLPGAVVQEWGQVRALAASRIVTCSRQDGGRRQAERLCLHRLAMLPAGHRA